MAGVQNRESVIFHMETQKEEYVDGGSFSSPIGVVA